MSAGDLRERITLQCPSRVSDGMGGFTTTWNDHATIWAEAWTVSSSEVVADMKGEMIRIQKFKIRYRNPLLPSWRIEFGERYFNIVAIDPDKKRTFIFITVRESI